MCGPANAGKGQPRGLFLFGRADMGSAGSLAAKAPLYSIDETFGTFRCAAPATRSQ